MRAKTVTRRLTRSRACVLATGFAALFWSSGASAQSSTNCIAMAAGMVHCDTMDMSPPRPVEVYQPRNDGGASLGETIGGLIARSRESAVRKRVGGMLADGDCQGAARYAYQKGRLELGAAIARTCAQGSPAPARQPAPAVLSAMPERQSVPAASPVPALAPRPVTTARAMGVSPEKRRRWNRYYATLIEAGTARTEAKAMADRELGPID